VRGRLIFTVIFTPSPLSHHLSRCLNVHTSPHLSPLIHLYLSTIIDISLCRPNMSEFSNSGHNPNPYQRNTHLNNDDSTSNSTISRFSEGLSIRTSVVANDEGSYEGSVLGFDSDGEVSTANTQSSTSTVNHSTTAKPRPVFDSEGRRISIHQFTYHSPSRYLRHYFRRYPHLLLSSVDISLVCMFIHLMIQRK
jgi:hypothetical protein